MNSPTSTTNQATTASTTHRRAVWEPPGPGSWLHDGSHASPSPTPLYRRIVSRYTEPIYREAMKRYGGPLGSMDMQFVNGALYRRLVPLIAPDRDKGKVPPAPVLWLATRIHPEFRRREKIAAKLLAEKTFLDDIEHWLSTERFDWIDRNRELESVDVTALDNRGLADHLRTLDERLVEGWYRHHELHGNDLGPIGDLLAHTNSWGIDPGSVMGLLRGSSPATTDAARHGREIATALESAGVNPAAISSIEEIRAVGPAGEALDNYLDTFGWRLISDYDIEGLTLHELPSAVVAIVRAATVDKGPVEETTDAAEAEVRSQAADAALFDELLHSARVAYGVRDDNGPLTWAWPAGLTRRAYLEAGERLAADGKIDDARHVFEVDIDELVSVLKGSTEPSSVELVQRAEHRAWERTLEAPRVLGPPPVEPDLKPLPPAMQRMMGIVLTAVTMLDPEPPSDEPTPAQTAVSNRTTTSGNQRNSGGDEGLTGVGVGSQTYRGTARVAEDPGRAIAAMKPGDVLVAPWTAPSFNAVLAIAGGVVVQEGGLLCHAAVMARELGIPAVVGCAGAMTRISEGDLVEVDPGSGAVRIITPANT